MMRLITVLLSGLAPSYLPPDGCLACLGACLGADEWPKHGIQLPFRCLICSGKCLYTYALKAEYAVNQKSSMISRGIRKPMSELPFGSVGLEGILGFFYALLLFLLPYPEFYCFHLYLEFCPDDV